MTNKLPGIKGRNLSNQSAALLIRGVAKPEEPKRIETRRDPNGCSGCDRNPQYRPLSGQEFTAWKKRTIRPMERTIP
ncbi:hypothetical protein Q7C36_023150 [Tachysurus vachellii]|uniref:Uncharacterized protein n=1 Tax=Tachysurus vachellii TaxID=175792 RepID=A0AA88IKQ0_TACVA|nr:hypothetical protein Q7C36_023150 [Tachysurus vachellii]